MKTNIKLLAALLLVPLAGLRAADPLADGFATPPRDSRSETWFHLIGGNVSKSGLTADLEAINGAGFEGIQLFHGNSRGPRLGLRYTMQNCPGWSQSGGPWIKLANTMRHLVWSRTDVSGGKSISSTLALPRQTREDWLDYRDVAVIAFSTPAGDDGQGLLPTAVRSNRDHLPWAGLFAARKVAAVKIAAGGEPAWVEVTLAKPATLRSLEPPPIEKFALRRHFDPQALVRGITAVVPLTGPPGLHRKIDQECNNAATNSSKKTS